MQENFSLEWSPSQKLFHVGPLQEALTNNLRNFMHDGNTDDWVIIFIGTEKGCDHIAATLEPTARKWAKA